MRVIHVRLGASLTGPTKSMARDLFSIAAALNRARNAMIRYFVRWHEDNPAWRPEPVLKPDGSPALFRGVPRVKNLPLPSVPCSARKVRGKMKETLAGATALYRAGARAAPEVARAIMSSASRLVWEDLKHDVPWRHDGKAHFVWQAVLAYEMQAPDYRRRHGGRESGLSIPVPMAAATIGYRGKCSSKIGVADLNSSDAAVLRLPLWSRDAGRKQLILTCRLNVGALPRAQRGLVNDLVAGTIKPSDSKLVWHARGKRQQERGWYLHLVAQDEPAAALDQLKVADLWCGAGDSAFVLESASRPREYGWARPLYERYARLIARRRAINFRSRVNHGGHGRGAFYAKLRPGTRAMQGLANAWRKLTAHQVAQSCADECCGGLVWHEPFGVARQWSVFGRLDIPFDWTAWQAQLRSACLKVGVALKVERGGPDAYRERLGGDQKPGGARGPQGEHATGVESLRYVESPMLRGRKGRPLAGGKITEDAGRISPPQWRSE